LADGLSHGRHQPLAVGLAGRRGLHHLPVAHHDQPVGHREDLAQLVRDEHAGLAFGHEAADVGQQLRGGLPVERGGRLVEDHQFQRLRPGRDGERARHFHDLPLADRQFAHHVVGPQAVARKDAVQRGHQLRARALAPGPLGRLRLRDAHVLREREVVAQRQFLEHAAQAPAPRLAQAPRGASAGRPAKCSSPRSVPARRTAR
jgi:hypothetical protein